MHRCSWHAFVGPERSIVKWGCPHIGLSEQRRPHIGPDVSGAGGRTPSIGPGFRHIRATLSTFVRHCPGSMALAWGWELPQKPAVAPRLMHRSSTLVSA
eukprot:4758045-Alexandrium_andersonii.AAC.1